MKKSIGVLLLVLTLSIGMVGCTEFIQPVENTDKGTSSLGVSPEEYLKSIDIQVQAESTKFSVDVPMSWDVKLGEYPVGLYWRLVNEFSKDAGFDLTPLKGSTVEVWRFALKDGLPGLKQNSQFTYPSNIVLLVKSQKVVGAWLAFNTVEIGPSVKKRYLEDITGITLEEWVDREKIFNDPGKNGDVASLSPTDLLDAFFKAINDGDKTRATACLSPSMLRETLTMNLPAKSLYNPGFEKNNSMVENILQAKPISYKLLDPKDNSEIQQVGERTEIEIAATLQMKWRDDLFSGRQTRFAGLKRYSNGWKITGLGTGP